MKKTNFTYLLRRIFGKPNNCEIIEDLHKTREYAAIGRMFKVVHLNGAANQRKAVLWRLTQEQIMNGVKADAIKIIYDSTKHLKLTSISYFYICKKTLKEGTRVKLIAGKDYADEYNPRAENGLKNETLNVEGIITCVNMFSWNEKMTCKYKIVLLPYTEEERFKKITAPKEIRFFLLAKGVEIEVDSEEVEEVK